MNILYVATILVALSSPVPACGCSPPLVETPSQAKEILARHDIVFVGVVKDKRYREIDPEYFGQNVRKFLLSFTVTLWVKGAEVEEINALAPLSVACERFPVSNEYLVFAKLVNGIYRIEYCTGARRTGPATDAEVDLLLDTAKTNNALH